MPKTVEKGWGREIIFADTVNYCGKLLHFSNEGATFSMHFHVVKDETWYVQQGSFKLRTIDTATAMINETILSKGDVWHNPVYLPHQLIALEDNSIIIETSTFDDPNDNYRVMPGDSQK
jgi:hypothetical protein